MTTAVEHMRNVRRLHNIAAHTPRYAPSINTFLEQVDTVLPRHRIANYREDYDDVAGEYYLSATLVKSRESRADAAYNALIVNTLERESTLARRHPWGF